jgi:nitrogen fixation NifU-like protein
MRDFPDVLRAHFETPHRIGEPPGGAHLRGEARNPVCGDHLVIYLRLKEGRVEAAGFRAKGCPAALATGSAACSVLEGLAVDATLPETLRRTFSERFGAPRPTHNHALSLCVEALAHALGDVEDAQS